MGRGGGGTERGRCPRAALCPPPCDASDPPAVLRTPIRRFCPPGFAAGPKLRRDPISNPTLGPHPTPPPPGIGRPPPTQPPPLSPGPPRSPTAPRGVRRGAAPPHGPEAQPGSRIQRLPAFGAGPSGSSSVPPRFAPVPFATLSGQKSPAVFNVKSRIIAVKPLRPGPECRNPDVSSAPVAPTPPLHGPLPAWMGADIAGLTVVIPELWHSCSPG